MGLLVIAIQCTWTRHSAWVTVGLSRAPRERVLVGDARRQGANRER